MVYTYKAGQGAILSNPCSPEQDLKETEASGKPTLHFVQLGRVEKPRIRPWSQVTKQVTAIAKFITQIFQPSLFPTLLLY